MRRRDKGHSTTPLAIRTHERLRPTLASAFVRAEALKPRATKLVVNLAFAENAEEMATGDVDGVGLLRSEFLMNDALGGVHPKLLVERGDEERFVEALATSILRVTRAFGRRRVIYRSLNFRSDEFMNLEGGTQFEPVEENPVLGYRGCYRYVHDPVPFQLELDALARVFDRSPNVALMLPFVRTAWEVQACLDLVRESPASELLPVWVVADVPSSLYRIPQYASLGIQGVSVGLKNLTQLTLGVDRDSEICAELFDETDAAVLDVVERIVAVSKSVGVETSITGLPIHNAGLVEHLVALSIGSISVNPDELDRTRLSMNAAVGTASTPVVDFDL